MKSLWAKISRFLSNPVWTGLGVFMALAIAGIPRILSHYETGSKVFIENPKEDSAVSMKFVLSGNGPRSRDRPLYAFRGGRRGAGASSTESKIVANIERGFWPKKRCAAVVPSGRVRTKL